MELLEVIRGRRSIRKYRPDPVDEKAVAAVLEAARLAPSWANRQCWRFIVVRDENTRAALADSLVQIDINGAAADNPSIRAVRSAPVVIVACAETGKSGYEFGRPATDKGDLWYMYDVALAMENMSLAAHSLGLGTVIIGAMDAQEMARILAVPEGFCVVALTPLGYPDQQPGPRPRKELAEIVFYERFGATR
ncbi:MAG: nitroreductase family protein [Chloroflexota bacterium]